MCWELVGAHSIGRRLTSPRTWGLAEGRKAASPLLAASANECLLNDLGEQDGHQKALEFARNGIKSCQAPENPLEQVDNPGAIIPT